MTINSRNPWEVWEIGNAVVEENTADEKAVAAQAVQKYAPLPASAHVTARADLRAILALGDAV